MKSCKSAAHPLARLIDNLPEELVDKCFSNTCLAMTSTEFRERLAVRVDPLPFLKNAWHWKRYLKTVIGVDMKPLNNRQSVRNMMALYDWASTRPLEEPDKLTKLVADAVSMKIIASTVAKGRTDVLMKGGEIPAINSLIRFHDKMLAGVAAKHDNVAALDIMMTVYRRTCEDLLLYHATQHAVQHKSMEAMAYVINKGFLHYVIHGLDEPDVLMALEERTGTIPSDFMTPWVAAQEGNLKMAKWMVESRGKSWGLVVSSSLVWVNGASDREEIDRRLRAVEEIVEQCQFEESELNVVFTDLKASVVSALLDLKCCPKPGRQFSVVNTVRSNIEVLKVLRSRGELHFDAVLLTAIKECNVDVLKYLSSIGFRIPTSMRQSVRMQIHTARVYNTLPWVILWLEHAGIDVDLSIITSRAARLNVDVAEWLIEKGGRIDESVVIQSLMTATDYWSEGALSFVVEKCPDATKWCLRRLVEGRFKVKKPSAVHHIQSYIDQLTGLTKEDARHEVAIFGYRRRDLVERLKQIII